MPTDPALLSKLDSVLAKIPGSRYKHMFGGIGIYFDEKMIAMLNDGLFFVKPSSGWDGGGREMSSPYLGAKVHWLLPEKMWTDPDKLGDIFASTASVLPAPKAKKK